MAEVYVSDVNARELVRVVVQHFPYGTTSGKLKEQFKRDTGLKNAAYYKALEVAKAKQWLVGGGGKKGQRYSLNPNGCWKESLWGNPITGAAASEQLTEATAERVRAYLALASEALRHINQD
jgi:hypothetical protein